jgi:Inner centromere protein, ARK binding region
LNSQILSDSDDDDSGTDDESEKEKQKMIPAWAKNPLLKEALEKQYGLNGQVTYTIPFSGSVSYLSF